MFMLLQLLLTLTFINNQIGFVVLAVRSPGEVSPLSLEIEVGRGGNITCSINIPGYNSTSIYFVSEDTNERVPPEDIYILDKSTIVYMIRNARIQYRNYICKVDKNGIDIVHVSVGTPPENITDIQCRAHDYSYMVCNFTIPENTIKPTYTLAYSAHSPNYVQPCEQLKIQGNQGICNLTLNNGYRPNYDFFNFTVNGKNSLGGNTQYFWINHTESVIPHRPEFHFESINSNSVSIVWKWLKFSFYEKFDMQYEILIRPENFDWINHSDYEKYRKMSDYKIRLRNLPYAFYNYEVSLRLRIKSSRADATIWSEPFVSQFRTSASLPQIAPSTDVGSFYIDSIKNKVILYWRQLLKHEENGPNFNYSIKEIRRDGEVINLLPLYMDGISAVFAHDKKHNYEFIIKSHNDVGDSVQASRIVVPKMHHLKTKSPMGIRNVYHGSNRTYTLSWNAPTNEKHMNDYTVFWCRPKPNSAECEGSMDFQHIDASLTKFNTLPQHHNLIMGVSANYHDNFSSGLHWSKCSADESSELVQIKPEIIESHSRNITIQWSPDMTCTSLVDGYNLTYCRVHNDTLQNHNECLEDIITLVMDQSARKFTLINLQPFTTYKMQMYMFSKYKTEDGPISEVKYLKTKQDAPSAPRSLHYHNVTSNSVWLSWMPPIYSNGYIRYYTIHEDSEKHILNCSIASACVNNNNDISTESESFTNIVSYKLKSLSSFTDYNIFVTAHTIADSEISNKIYFRTLIGVPSSPQQVTSGGFNQGEITWERPLVPAGPISFYEVAITVWDKQQKIGRHASLISANETKCKFSTPVCTDKHMKHTVEVRAINEALISNIALDEQAQLRASSDIIDSLNDYYNDDLTCVGKSKVTPRNSEEYVMYISKPEGGTVFLCFSNSAYLNNLFFIIIIGLIVIIFVMIPAHMARKKVIAMYNIYPVFPEALQEAYINKLSPETGKSPINNENNDIYAESEIQNSKEFNFLNENHHLLSDADYGLMTPSSIGGKSSGYVGSGSEHSLDENVTPIPQSAYITTAELNQPIQSADSAYMTMQVLNGSNKKPLDKEQPILGYTHLPRLDQASQTGGYVQPQEFTRMQQPRPQHLMLPPTAVDSGYIKPNNLWHLQAANQMMSGKSVGDALHSNSPYIQPQMLQKNNPPTLSGYTALEALNKASYGEQNEQHTSPAHALPNSGYVTQRDLSAYGHQRMNS